MGSLFGSKGTKSTGVTQGGGTSTGSTSSTSTGSSSSTQQSSSSTTPGFMQELQAILNKQAAGTTGFTKQDAINDVQSTLQQQATDALQSVMPSIARSQTGAGAYNSTTKQLLQNDANARITGQLANTTSDLITKYAGIEQGLINAFANATQAGTSQQSQSTGSSASNQSSSSVGQTNSTQWNTGQQNSKGGGSGLLGLFADGGQVPTTGTGSLEEYLQEFLANSGLQDTFKQATDTMTNPSSNMIRKTDKAIGGIETKIEDYVIDSVLSSFLGFANGGQVPEQQDLRQAIMKYQAGGKVRSGEEDVQAGGKIQGKESKTGEDNQVIGVAGGEGILAKDVMEVPGVAQLVELLNSKFHKPT